MSCELTDADLEKFVKEVDIRLDLLPHFEPATDAGLPPSRKSLREIYKMIDPERTLEAATGEECEIFWDRFLRHARKDLCHRDGMLYKNWKQFKEIEKKGAVRISYVWLSALGLQAHAILVLVAPLAVFLIVVATKIGIDTICEDCPEEIKN